MGLITASVTQLTHHASTVDWRVGLGIIQIVGRVDPIGIGTDSGATPYGDMP